MTVKTTSGFEYAGNIQRQRIPYYGYVKIPFTRKTILWPTGYRAGRFEDKESAPQNIVTSRQVVEVLSSFTTIKQRQMKHFLIVEGID